MSHNLALIIVMVAILALCTSGDDREGSSDLNSGARLQCVGASVTWSSMVNETGHNTRVRSRCEKRYPPRYKRPNNVADIITDEERAEFAAQRDKKLREVNETFWGEVNLDEPDESNTPEDQNDTVRIYENGQFHWGRAQKATNLDEL